MWMYADGLKQALRRKMYEDGVGMGTCVMGMGWNGEKLVGWVGYGENKLSPGSSLLTAIVIKRATAEGSCAVTFARWQDGKVSFELLCLGPSRQKLAKFSHYS